MKPQPRKKGETFTSNRVTPAEKYVRELEGEYYLLSEVAEKVGVAPGTLRRLIKSPTKKVNAPSFVGHQGAMPLYIFSKDDLEEIRTYYATRYHGFNDAEAGEGRGPGRPRNRVPKQPKPQQETA